MAGQNVFLFYRYCSEHALKATLSRNRQNAKNPAPLSAESLLTSLSHHVKKPRNRSASSSSYISDEERTYGEEMGETKVIKTLDPFVDIDANAVYNEQCNEVLDMCSESESDVEPSTYATVWHDANADSSDNESIDSEDEDPLKHANVYTAEEISLITRDKLVRLQSLYIEEYKHLRYLLRERRRKYIHSLKREKETCCNIYNQVRDNPKEQRLYRKLNQYNKYHKAYGEEAILEKKLHDLRAKISEGVPSKSSSFVRCQFTEGGVKCGERALPLAKHCRKHILEDPNQILFKACGKKNADVECNTPVEAIFDDSTCKLHMEVPPIRSYSQPRRESESDADDSLDLPPHYTLPANDNVKTEMIDYSLPSLPKMETLPSILFEDSAESLSSTLQYSTSEFTESFAEQNSIDVPENITAGENEINVTSMDTEDTNNESIKANDEDCLEPDNSFISSHLLNVNTRLEPESINDESLIKKNNPQEGNSEDVVNEPEPEEMLDISDLGETSNPNMEETADIQDVSIPHADVDSEIENLVPSADSSTENINTGILETNELVTNQKEVETKMEEKMEVE